MKTISKSRPKSTMLQIFDEIEKSGESVVVTDRHRPVLKIERIAGRKTLLEIFDSYQGLDHLNNSALGPERKEWGEY